MAKRDWHAKVYKKSRTMTRLEREEWRNVRKAVLERDLYTCQRCMKTSKSGKGLSVHHLLPRSSGGTNELGNLITLCHKCHDYVELESLMTVDEIIASADDPIEYPAPKQENEYGETFERPAWHAWVYGGQKNPRY